MNIRTLSTLALPFVATLAIAQGKPVQAKLVNGVQVATIMVDNGRYTPSMVQVKKGLPVALTFKTGKNPGCGAYIEFKSLNLKLTAREGKPAVFKFKPTKAGEIKFACSMDMFRGKVVVR